MSTDHDNRATKLRIAAVAVGLLWAAALAAAVGIVLVTRDDDRWDSPVTRFSAASHPGFAQRGRESDRKVTVHAGDYWFKLSTPRVTAGRVTLTARNLGGTRHDVMIERLPIKFSAPGVPVDEAAQGGLDMLASGAARTTTLVLTPGRYGVFCTAPGHFRAGQHGELTVVRPA